MNLLPPLRQRPSAGFEAGLIRKRREASEAARSAARRKQVNALRTYRIGEGSARGEADSGAAGFAE